MLFRSGNNYTILLLTISPSDTKGKKKQIIYLKIQAAFAILKSKKRRKIYMKIYKFLKLGKDHEIVETKNPHQKPQYKYEKWILTGHELGSI